MQGNQCRLISFTKETARNPAPGSIKDCSNNTLCSTAREEHELFFIVFNSHSFKFNELHVYWLHSAGLVSTPIKL